MIPSWNRIEISVKGDTCVLLGVKGLMKNNRDVNQILLNRIGSMIKYLFLMSCNDFNIFRELQIFICSYIFIRLYCTRINGMNIFCYTEASYYLGQINKTLCMQICTCFTGPSSAPSVQTEGHSYEKPGENSRLVVKFLSTKNLVSLENLKCYINYLKPLEL